MTAPSLSRFASLPDGLKLAAGTFTSIRVPPPNHVDAGTWGVALTVAPLIAGLLGVGAAIPGVALWALASRFDTETALTSMITGLAAVLTYAVATRALHFDGLIDTVDGFGSARTGDAALAVMRDPAMGAFGGVALVLAVLMQAAAWGQIVTTGSVWSTATVSAGALMLARAPLMWSTRVGTPAANGGLAHGLVGQFGAGLASAVGAVWTVAAGALLVLAGVQPAMAVAAVILVWAAAVGLRRAAIRRFAAVTGDVLGAIVEVGATVALVLAALGRT